MDYYSVIKRNKLSSHKNTWKIFKSIPLRIGWGKPVGKGCNLNGPDDAAFRKQQNWENSKNTSNCEGLWEGEKNKGE